VKRAYREINYFERQLVDFGTILFKFWLHIDQEEQLRRFESRADDRLRSWKLTDEDWRNREKWAVYNEAVNECCSKPVRLLLLDNCGGQLQAYARIKILKTMVEKLSSELNFNPFEDKAVRQRRGKKQKK